MEWEPYAYTLAWVAFREYSLLDTMREAEAKGGLKAALRLLADANMATIGEQDSGPRRRDGKSYRHCFIVASSAAGRLMFALRKGLIRARAKRLGEFETPPPRWWDNDIRIAFDKELIFFSQPTQVSAVSEFDWTTLECCFEDVRAEFAYEYSRVFRHGEWHIRPVLHKEGASRPSANKSAMNIEASATEALAGHLAKLSEEQRDRFRREDAEAFLAADFGLGPKAFDRVWAAARRRAGMPSRASAGRKRKSKSPR